MNIIKRFFGKKRTSDTGCAVVEYVNTVTLIIDKADGGNWEFTWTETDNIGLANGFRKWFHGRPQSLFFEAVMADGIMMLPREKMISYSVKKGLQASSAKVKADE